MDHYSTELAAMMERMYAQLGRPIVRLPLSEVKPIKISYGPHYLRVRWLRTKQLWRVERAAGLAASAKDGLGLLSDAQAVNWAKQIIRAAIAVA